ncbi:hypothetical protein BGZ49_003153 [Haplosporangium sp. Z 27]|nr:hypothetical protein BGZ49_003153 [Haplosporangium sp. Z 27]
MNTEPWPAVLGRVLDRIPFDGLEKLWYPPYCTLLSTVFTLADGYLVAPVTFPKHNTQSMDLAVEYLVQNEEGIPVLGMEIKRAGDIELLQARTEADRQVRERFATISSPLPRFHIVSAIGKRCCVYTFDRATRTITPPRIAPTNPSIVEDLAPIDRWNIDLGQLDGRLALNAIFNDVKNMVASQ